MKTYKFHLNTDSTSGIRYKLSKEDIEDEASVTVVVPRNCFERILNNEPALAFQPCFIKIKSPFYDIKIVPEPKADAEKIKQKLVQQGAQQQAMNVANYQQAAMNNVNAAQQNAAAFNAQIAAQAQQGLQQSAAAANQYNAANQAAQFSTSTTQSTTEQKQEPAPAEKTPAEKYIESQRVWESETCMAMEVIKEPRIAYMIGYRDGQASKENK